MPFNDIEKKRYDNLAKAFLERRRPPIHIRNQLDLSYRIRDLSVIILEIRPHWKNPEKKNRRKCC